MNEKNILHESSVDYKTHRLQRKKKKKNQNLDFDGILFSAKCAVRKRNSRVPKPGKSP